MSLARSFAKSSFFRAFETVISIGVGFFMLPFLLHQLGEDIYGVWVLVGSITGAFYLFDLGFASAVTRFIASALASSNRAEAQRIVSTAWLIYCALAAIIAILTPVLCLLVPYVAPHSGHTHLIQILILITGLNLAIEFPVKAYAGIASYHLRYDLLAAARIFFKIISTAMIVWALLSGYGVVTMALIALVAQILSNIVFKEISRYLEPKLRVRVKCASRRHFKALFNYSFWTLVIDVSEMVQKRSDLWVIGFFLSKPMLAVYYVGVRLAEYAFQLLTSAASMGMPLFTRDYTRGDIPALIKKLLFFTRLNLTLGILAFVCFTATGSDLIHIWMGAKFDFSGAYEAGNLIIASRMVFFSAMPITGAFMAVYKPRVLSFVGLLETGILVVLLLLFVGVLRWGIQGSAWAVFFAFAITRPFVLPILIARELNFSLFTFYWSLWRVVLFGAIAGLVSIGLGREISPYLGNVSFLLVEASILMLLAFMGVSFIIRYDELELVEQALGTRFSGILLWPKLVLHKLTT